MRGRPGHWCRWTKHPLALVEGSTENATLALELLVGLRDRGLHDPSGPGVLDGAKALSKAVREVFDKPVLQRRQEHKIRNVRDRLPEKLRSLVQARMRQAYHADLALAAEAKLTALARTWTRLTRAAPRRSAKVYKRHSPCCGSVCHRRPRPAALQHHLGSGQGDGPPRPIHHLQGHPDLLLRPAQAGNSDSTARLPCA